MRRRTRTMTGMFVVTMLAATGCGSDEDAATVTTSDDTADDTASDETASNDTGSSETGSNDTGSNDTGSTEGPADSPATDDRVMITSFEDIPQECLDLTAEFLRTIEPIVSPIDWDNGTMSDFESIAEAFETEAEAFDVRSAEACASIDLADDGLSVMIDFAQEEAPGTVQFLTFLDALQNASLGLEPSLDDEPLAFEDCAGAIEFIDALMESYDRIVDVPVADMLQVANVGSIFMSCTPEQQAFFDSPEVTEFFQE